MQWLLLSPSCERSNSFAVLLMQEEDDAEIYGDREVNSAALVAG